MKTLFKLGARLRDKLTGIEGTAINYYFHLSGCQYVEIEPDPEGNKRSEAIYLPEERCEFVSEGGDLKQPEIETCHVKLGDKVKDNLTGFTGHATMIQIPLYGVGRVSIDPGLKKKEPTEMAEGYFFDEQRVEVIETKAPPVAKEMPEKRKTRGCAPARVPAHMR